ncbi:hypothetical protein HDU67_000678, partial [Dinochytrium kinnereticum]
MRRSAITPCLEIRVDLDRWSHGDVDMAVVTVNGGPHPTAVARCVRDVSFGRFGFVLSVSHPGCAGVGEEVVVVVERGVRRSGVVLNGEPVFAMVLRGREEEEEEVVGGVGGVEEGFSDDDVSLSESSEEEEREADATLTVQQQPSLDRRGSLTSSVASSSVNPPPSTSSYLQNMFWARNPTPSLNLTTPPPPPSKPDPTQKNPSPQPPPSSPTKSPPTTLPTPFDQIQTIAETALARLTQLSTDTPPPTSSTQKTTPWTSLPSPKRGLAVAKKVINFGNTPGSFPVFRGGMILEGVAPEEGRRDMIVVVMDRQRPTRVSTPGGMIGSTYMSVAASIPETLLSTTARKRLEECLAMALRRSSGRIIRALLSISGWVLEPVDPYGNERFLIPSTRATVFSQVDLGGGMPEFYYDSMVQHHTKAPWTLNAFLKQHNAVPVINWPVIPFLPSEEPTDPRFATPIITRKPLHDHHFTDHPDASTDATSPTPPSDTPPTDPRGDHMKIRTTYDPVSRVFAVRLDADFTSSPLKRSLAAISPANHSADDEDAGTGAVRIRVLEFTVDGAAVAGVTAGYDVLAVASKPGVVMRCEVREVAPDRRGGAGTGNGVGGGVGGGGGIGGAIAMAFGGGTMMGTGTRGGEEVVKAEMPRHHVSIFAVETVAGSLEGRILFDVTVRKASGGERERDVGGGVVVGLNGKRVRVIGWRAAHRIRSPVRKTSSMGKGKLLEKRRPDFPTPVPISTDLGKQNHGFERTTPSSIFAELDSPTGSMPMPPPPNVSSNHPHSLVGLSHRRNFSSSAPGAMTSPIMKAMAKGATGPAEWVAKKTALVDVVNEGVGSLAQDGKEGEKGGFGRWIWEPFASRIGLFALVGMTFLLGYATPRLHEVLAVSGWSHPDGLFVS